MHQRQIFVSERAGSAGEWARLSDENFEALSTILDGIRRPSHQPQSVGLGGNVYCLRTRVESGYVIQLVYEIRDRHILVLEIAVDRSVAPDCGNPIDRRRPGGQPPAHGNTPARECFDQDAWHEQALVFEQRLPELLKSSTYRSRYVALRDGQIVDHDCDVIRLTKRVSSKYRGTTFIGEVADQRSHDELSSPEEQA